MSHTITRVEDVPLGDTKRLPFTAIDEDADTDDAPLDLTGAEITYELRPSKTADPVLSLADDGVTIVTRDNAAGEFTIEFGADATADLDPRVYRERVQIVDDGGNKTTWIGHLEFVTDR